MHYILEVSLSHVNKINFAPNGHKLSASYANNINKLDGYICWKYSGVIERS